MAVPIPGDPVSSFASGFGQSLGAGIVGEMGGGSAGTKVLQSGAPFDARSFMDGSGWTVSTGKSSATGATVSHSADPFGPSPVLSPVSPQSGQPGGLSALDPLTLLALGAVFLFLAKRRNS